MVLHQIDQPGSFIGSWFKGHPIPNQFDTDEETSPSNVTDQIMMILELTETIQKTIAQSKRSFLKLLVLDDIENRHRAGAGHGIASEGREEFHAIVKGIRYGPGRHDSSHGMPIADRLTHHHDVWNDIGQFESPEGFTDPTESDLHLVGDAEPTSSTDMLEGRREIAFRQRYLTTTGEDGFREETGDRSSSGTRFTDDSSDLQGIARARPGIPDLPSIDIGNRNDMDPWLRFMTAWPLELVGTHLDAVGRVSVIGAIDHEHIVGSGRGSGKPERQFIGFGSRVDEVADVQTIRQRAAEPGGIVRDILMEISGVRVQDSRLGGDGLHHMRMTMPDMTDIVHEIEIRPAIRGEQVLAAASRDMERSVVTE